ncbi:DUF6701 domain-containing protein [Herminiimonas fonticola]|uniref:DUF6701 domain-containing protein n=1 Tax=Herminiimonas fonticola TaxID=303380 RepID=UPI001060FD8D|nr:DUF6701 domain-containing protein [Herminiimonas fonticola]
MGLTTDASAQVVFRAASSAALQAGSPGISYVGRGSVDNASSGSISPGLPTYQTGDLILCVVESHDNVAHTISSGWNTLYSLTSGNGHRASLFWRIAANTSLADPTIGHSAGNSIISRCASYRGIDQTTPFDVPFSSATSVSDTTIESGSINVITNGAWVLFANHMAENPGSLTMTTTGGRTWTNRIFSTTGNALDSGVGLFDTGPLTPTPQTVGPVVATTNVAAESTGALLALRPAGGNVLTINKPAGVLADDLMIASVSVGSSTIIVTPPSGWILVRQVVRSGANSSTLQTYYRIATASDPASFSWTFSGGTHVGAVGGITAFSGVDLVTPIANEAGAATNSATTHIAPSVITSKVNSMLVTVHEYSSSGTWTPPGGMTEAVDIASRPVPDAAGLAMEMNYELRPAFGATGTRQATANGNADLGATQSLAINPSGGLSCFGDGFDRANGAPGTDWLVGNVGGTFGNPAIVNNRLRLTNNSAQVSTYATLQRLFPAAGNKIVIEFMQYSYAGTGADGMGIVLSDAAESPIAGAFGGSLGYAPKQTSLGGDTTHEGFSGGWLGVALDEFGNYSSNTEGRSGGSAPGFTPDSVAIRGSGSGFTGYSYLRGTGTLPVGIDNAASATAAPGHKYRIIVDHSDGVHAWTSVERDTTGTGNSYGFVVPAFDAKAESGQAAVPTNWSISYTGATGGSGNIHEIDSLQVCSITQRALTLHHIQLEYPGKICGSGGVTVKACADAACTALYTGTVTVDLAATRTSGAGTPSFSLDPVTFTGGQTTVTLNKTNTSSAAIVSIGGTATSPITGNATTCLSDTGATNCNVSFVSACFDAVETSTNTPATPIYTKLANTSFNLRILAIRNSAIDTSNNGSVTVTLVDPTIAGNCDGTAAGLVTSQTINLTNGIGTVNGINYANAAKNVKARMTSGGISTCSTDNFAIRPQQFNLSTDAGTPGPYAAGTDFHIAATSVTGYDGTPTLNLTQVTATPGSTNIPLSGDFSAASGTTSQGTFQYDDVGTLDFNIAPTDFTAVFDPDFTAVDQVTGVVNGVNHGTSPDCLNGSATNAASGGRYGCTIGSSTLSAGRFRPDHYDVTATLTAACENKFTYMGQPALGVTIGLQAMSANGTQLVRYGTGYSPLSKFSIVGNDAGAAISRTGDYLVSTSSGIPVLPKLDGSEWNSGFYSIDANNYNFVRATTPDGSYENFSLRTTINDTDGVFITSLNGVATVANTNSVLSNTTALRFGRLKLANVNGSELMNASLQASAEYWKNGTGFVTNTDDNCTVIDASAIKLQNQLLGLNASNMPANNFIASPLSFAAGQSSIIVKKPLPTPTAKGSVDVCIDLASDNTPGTVCSTATPANMPWLQGKWNGTLYDDDPGARVTLGIFRSGPVVYLREIY